MRQVATLLLATGIVFSLGCGLKPLPAGSAEDPASRLRQSTYIEDGPLLALVVGVRPARFRTKESYVPLEIAVANKALEALDLTLESFSLVAADGTRYPAVGAKELLRDYGSPDRDRVYAEAEPAILSRFQSFARIPSNMVPGFDRPSARDRVSLRRFSFIYDFLYFTRPDEAMLAEPVTLLVDSPQLEDPVFIRFPLPKRNKE